MSAVQCPEIGGKCVTSTSTRTAPNPRVTNGMAAESKGSSKRYLPKPPEEAFVEDQLRLPDAWAELDNVQAMLSHLYGRKTMTESVVSDLSARIEERELGIINTKAAEFAQADSESGKPMSEAHKDRVLNMALRNSEDLRELRDKLRDSRNELAGLDNDIRTCELHHRSLIARINSQSTVLDFYRSARDARTVVTWRAGY